MSDPTSTVNVKKARRTVAAKRSRPATPPMLLTETDVARRAYLIYLEEGCPQGRHVEHWLRAESELRS